MQSLSTLEFLLRLVKLMAVISNHYCFILQLVWYAVRWLSRGKVLKRILDLKDEISIFLKNNNNERSDNSSWIATHFYLVDNFEMLRLNLSLQGGNKNISYFIDSLKAFVNNTKTS